MTASTTVDERRIRKDASAVAVTPNLLDYEQARASFSWSDARAIVVAAIADVAPDLEAGEITPESQLRDDLDRDSMDLNLTAALSDQLGADIPERDYPRMLTVEGCATYLLGEGS